nr:hypothetical protein [Bilophila wadsworthia]
MAYTPLHSATITTRALLLQIQTFMAAFQQGKKLCVPFCPVPLP